MNAITTRQHRLETALQRFVSTSDVYGQSRARVDIVEYNPRCDISNQTTLVAAKLLKEIAGMMVKTAAR